MTNVAFLGTGLLGSGMVEGMLGRGDKVTVWNRTEAKARALEADGAKIARSPEDGVAAADHVHLALPDDGVVDAIIARFAPRLRPGIRFLHAPVFMTPQMCRESKGLMLVSGPAIAKRMDEAIAKGHGQDDFAAISAELVTSS